MRRSDIFVRLSKHGERDLYCDTDSVIFVQKEGEPPPVQCGDALGDYIRITKKSTFQDLLAGILRTKRINFVILLRGK